MFDSDSELVHSCGRELRVFMFEVWPVFACGNWVFIAEIVMCILGDSLVQGALTLLTKSDAGVMTFVVLLDFATSTVLQTHVAVLLVSDA